MADVQDNASEAQPTRRRFRRGPRLKLIAAIVVGVIVLVWLTFWIYHRMTHVSESDAQVASHVITVSSRLDGRVTGFDLIEGDHLKRNALIAQLYSTPDTLKRDQLKAHIANLEAQLNLAGRQIAGGVDQTQSMLTADKAAQDAAKARMDKAHDNYRRAQNLYEAHGGTEKQRDIYRYDYQSAKAEYAKAQSQVAMDEIAIANARTGLLPGGQISNPDVLRTQLKVARAELAHQQNMIDDLAVKAPIKGVVDQTFIEQDEYVAAGQPILMMHDPNDVWIQAKIKETKIADLRVGQPVAIHVDARPDSHYTGHVQVIGNAATNQFAMLPDPNPSGNFTKITQRIPVRIAIDHGAKARLAPGMMVEVDIDITGNGHRRTDDHPGRAPHTRAPQNPPSASARQTPPADASSPDHVATDRAALRLSPPPKVD